MIILLYDYNNCLIFLIQDLPSIKHLRSTTKKKLFKFLYLKKLKYQNKHRIF